MAKVKTPVKGKPGTNKPAPGKGTAPGKPSNPKPVNPKPPAKSPQEQALESLYGVQGDNAGNALMNKFMQPGTLGRVGGTGEVLPDGTVDSLSGSGEQLQRQQQLMDQARNSDAQQDALRKMQSGLSGYTSPEYQASREQMMRGQQSNFQTSQAQLAKAQARGKVYGAAGAAQQANLAASSAQSKDQLEQDLMVKNIDEQQRRLQDYGRYGTELQGQQFDQRAAATQAYGDTQAAMREEELGRQKVNLGQANAETASQIGLYTGAGGTALAKAQNKAAQGIQKQGIAAINGRPSTNKRPATRR